MADDTNLEELRARAAAAVNALQAAENEAAVPLLPLNEAQEVHDTAVAALEFAERPFWDLEHATVDLNGAREAVKKAQADVDALKDAPDSEQNKALLGARQTILEVAQSKVPALEAALAAAEKALADHPVALEDVDKVAQAMIDARAIVAKAQEA